MKSKRFCIISDAILQLFAVDDEVLGNSVATLLDSVGAIGVKQHHNVCHQSFVEAIGEESVVLVGMLVLHITGVLKLAKILVVLLPFKLWHIVAVAAKSLEFFPILI